MKLSPRDAPAYFAKPDPRKTGILIYGADAMRVALRRQEVIKGLIGPQGEDEMRLTRMAGAELRKDPAMLLDAIKAAGFFPGPRVAFVEDSTDAVFPMIDAALSDWAEGDAQIVVTAGALKKTSKLRKAFENHAGAYAIGLYDDPPGRAEIDAILAGAGVPELDRDARQAIENLARALDPGDFRQTVDKLGLYMRGETAAVTVEDIEAVAPQSVEAGLDEIIAVVAEARSDEIGPLMRRIVAQGTAPVTLCIMTSRHFRQLFAVASDPGGPQSGIGRLRPPVFGPRRDRMLRQAQGWGAAKLQDALQVLIDTDLQLRSAGQTAPQMAVVERAFIRLAMMARR